MILTEITDFHAPELDVYARLTEAQLLNRHCLKEGLFIAESPKVIGRALDAGYEPVSFLVERKHLQEGSESREVLARCPDVPVFTAEFDLLTQLTGYQLTRGLLCAMRRKSLPRMEDVIKSTKRIAVLEEIMNPTNIGAIFRSAAALGMVWGVLDEVHQRFVPGRSCELRDMCIDFAGVLLGAGVMLLAIRMIKKRNE